jgi:acetylglutamate kinase
MSTAPTVLKLGGELLEDTTRLGAVASAIARAAAQVPLIVVHGGGKEIDAALAAAGIQKQQVDGVRVTDAATLAVVVPVLAGAINTRLVAAVAARGGRAVGLTGVDATVAPAEPMPPLRTMDGRTVTLGFVGRPLAGGHASLLGHLVSAGYIPVISSISADRAGTIFNVNADTMAAAVAVRTGARRLVIAGTTPGVLDATGRRVPELGAAAEATLVAAGTINAGMVAKLTACRQALAGGVGSVVIGDGRGEDRLLDMVLARETLPAGTTIVGGDAG